MLSDPPPSSVDASKSNWTLVRRLWGLAWRYRLRCLQVLGLQLVLLSLGLAGLSLTGVGIDYIRYVLGKEHPSLETPEIAMPVRRGRRRRSSS
jgi:ATP-binding cassette subfamily B protein